MKPPGLGAMACLAFLHASAALMAANGNAHRHPGRTAESATRSWVETIVIGERLCPWAQLADDSFRLCVVETAAQMAPAAAREARELLARSAATYPTTLLVLDEKSPDAAWMERAEEFGRVCAAAQRRVNGAARGVSVLGFHPWRLDAGVTCSADPDDAGHFSVRSPLPTLQLLRDGDLAAARRKWKRGAAAAAYPGLPGALGLLHENKRRLRAIGSARLREQLQRMRGGAVTPRLRGGARRAAHARMAAEAAPPIPLTVLSGFLGAGKTTLLRHLLENKAGLRVGVVVNDVAAVNVDAKLVQRDGRQAAGGGVGEEWAEDMVELSNGCACCSAGDDFFGALAQLVSLSFMRGVQYDHIVFEASGVAEPKLLRAMFQEASAAGWPLMSCVRLESMCTVVDASNFLELFESCERIEERADLGYVPPEEQEGWAGVVKAMGAEAEEASVSVVQLLAEQIEIADVLVLNKADRVDADRIRQLEQTLGAINGFADVLVVEFGKVPLDRLLVPAREAGVALSNEVMDHQSAVDFAMWLRTQPQPAAGQTASADEHSHAADCGDPACTDPSHGHEHSHAKVCGDPACTDPSHGHEHSHAKDCGDPACTDPSHDHEHSHATDCEDPACTDPSHGHEHSHDRQQTTAATRFGISTFVYSRRRPFSQHRLGALVRKLRFLVSAKTCQPFASVSEAAEEEGKPASSRAGREEGACFNDVLRSKGFLWLAGESDVAYYWSQAGSHLDLSEMGRWWASVPPETWPEAHKDSIRADFDGENGDRRQELVFIGAGLSEDAISAALDACLLSDAEMAEHATKVETAKRTS